MTYLLLDTNVLSYLFKPDHRFYDQCASVTRGCAWCISFMTRAELLLWPDERHWGERRRRQLDDLMAACTTLYPDEHTCLFWCDISLESRRQGRTIAVADTWNAGIAMQYDIPLVTADYKVFAHLDGLQVLRIA